MIYEKKKDVWNNVQNVTNCYWNNTHEKLIFRNNSEVNQIWFCGEHNVEEMGFKVLPSEKKTIFSSPGNSGAKAN